jgi:hypothetical protein
LVSSESRSFSMAVRIRVFAVPSGIRSSSLISWAVRPRKAARNRARRCSGGSPGDGAAYALALVWWGALIRGAAGNAGLLKLGRHEVGIERLGRLHPDDVNREVAGDRQEPGHDTAAPRIVGSSVLPGSHERLLSHVLGRALVTNDCQDEAIDTRLEAAREGRGGVRVAGRET